MTGHCRECFTAAGLAHRVGCSAAHWGLSPAPCDWCGKPATPRRFHGDDSVGWRYDLLCPECRAVVRETVPPADADGEGATP